MRENVNAYLSMLKEVKNNALIGSSLSHQVEG